METKDSAPAGRLDFSAGKNEDAKRGTHGYSASEGIES